MAGNNTSQSGMNRLLSLDFFRGLTMFLLIGSGTGLYRLMRKSDFSPFLWIGNQFDHPEWIGLTMWDFVEPFFMFIVGVAIPFAVMKRMERGDTWNKVFRHVVQRSLILFLLGITIYSVSAGKPVFRLWNVLTQLSFTYLLGFILMNKPVKWQIIISFALLLLTELLYRFWPVEGFNQAFVPDHNFGTWVDLKLMGTIQNEHWVAFNVVPTAAHTIWGVLAGLLLRSGRTDNQKLKILVLTGLAGVIAGLALTPISPFIKKIATSSVVIETGGFCLLFMAFAFWLVDVKKIHKIPFFFSIVGMNPIFMYLIWMVGVGPFLSRIAKPFSYALFFWSGETIMAYATALITWFFLWYICYFFYKHKIFIKV